MSIYESANAESSELVVVLARVIMAPKTAAVQTTVCIELRALLMSESRLCEHWGRGERLTRQMSLRMIPKGILVRMIPKCILLVATHLMSLHLELTIGDT